MNDERDTTTSLPDERQIDAEALVKEIRSIRSEGRRSGHKPGHRTHCSPHKLTWRWRGIGPHRGGR